MRRLLPLVLSAIACLLPAACANQEIRSKQTILTETLRAYSAAIRWGEYEQAVGFIDPKIQAEHPVTAFELERLRQVRVSNYDEGQPVVVSPDEVRQVVRLDLLNVNTQVARSIVDQRSWRYDAASKHWWLTSGLPDITRRD
ncbi:MAG: hypothetical protein KF903_14035 [Dokdonella sp.]|uniref:hypothetical protein n=1 Tax=Dokdonella sp. TaxID=2291710 RepID=UPI0025C65E76|nr:hypothetical protein [Dokdonella sp.]MBX3702107.1 hypothetical protein [Dokdonella sp.]MCW5578695.1 hypothetical protein [Dokdonella sp.]